MTYLSKAVRWVFRHIPIITLGIMCGLLGAVAFAADVTAPQTLDGRGLGKVATPHLLNQGNVSLGLSWYSGTGLNDAEESYLEENLEALEMQRFQASSLHMSYGLDDAIELLVSFHATHETADPGYRDILYGPETNGSTDPRSMDFSGATLATKIAFAQDGLFKFAVMPFVESGVGPKADRALTRSTSSRLGWMALAGLGKKDTAELWVNAGYRYRHREWLGDLLMRNELVYQASLSAALSSHLGIFATGQGRQLTASQTDDFGVDGERAYYGIESGEFSTGLKLKVDDLSIKAFAGQSIQDDAFGYSDKHFGAQLSMVLGKKTKRSLADDVRSKQDRDRELRNWRPEDAQAEKKPAGPAKQGEDAAPSAGALNMFADVDKMLAEEMESQKNDPEYQELKEERRYQPSTKKAEIDTVEDELEQLREAEELLEEEEAKKNAIEEELRQKDALKIYQENLRREQEYRKEMHEEIEALPDVTEEDYGWSGLEE